MINLKIGNLFQNYHRQDDLPNIESICRKDPEFKQLIKRVKSTTTPINQILLEKIEQILTQNPKKLDQYDPDMNERLIRTIGALKFAKWVAEQGVVDYISRLKILAKYAESQSELINAVFDASNPAVKIIDGQIIRLELNKN